MHLAMVAVQESMPKKKGSHAVNQESLSSCRLVKPSLPRSHSLPLLRGTREIQICLHGLVYVQILC